MGLSLRRALVCGGLLGASGALAVACGGDDTANPVPADAGGDKTVAADGPGTDSNAPDTNQPDTSGPDTGSPDTGTDAGAVDRGPTTLPFNGDPNGLFWDYGVGAALYIADSANNSIQKWTDTAGFTTAIALPAPPPLADGGPADPTLGQVIRLLDGTTLVTRFGFGAYGAIVVVGPKGDAGVVTGTVDGGPVPLSTKKRRIGLAMLADGTIVDTYFQPTPDGGPRVGAIAKVNVLAGTEKDFITGFAKPIGVAQNEKGQIFVTDQDLGYLVQSPLAGGAFVDPDAGIDAAGDGGDAGPQPSVAALLASSDLICVGPDGSFFTGSSAGTVYKIDKTNTVTSFQTGLKSARGCAYDGANKRLFVAEHDPAGAAHAIRIFPVP